MVKLVAINLLKSNQRLHLSLAFNAGCRVKNSGKISPINQCYRIGATKSPALSLIMEKKHASSHVGSRKKFIYVLNLSSGLPAFLFMHERIKIKYCFVLAEKNFIAMNEIRKSLSQVIFVLYRKEFCFLAIRVTETFYNTIQINVITMKFKSIH